MHTETSVIRILSAKMNKTEILPGILRGEAKCGIERTEVEELNKKYGFISTDLLPVLSIQQKTIG